MTERMGLDADRLEMTEFRFNKCGAGSTKRIQNDRIWP